MPNKITMEYFKSYVARAGNLLPASGWNYVRFSNPDEEGGVPETSSPHHDHHPPHHMETSPQQTINIQEINPNSSKSSNVATVVVTAEPTSILPAKFARKTVTRDQDDAPSRHDISVNLDDSTVSGIQNNCNYGPPDMPNPFEDYDFTTAGGVSGDSTTNVPELDRPGGPGRVQIRNLCGSNGAQPLVWFSGTGRSGADVDAVFGQPALRNPGGEYPPYMGSRLCMCRCPWRWCPRFKYHFDRACRDIMLYAFIFFILVALIIIFMQSF